MAEQESIPTTPITPPQTLEVDDELLADIVDLIRSQSENALRNIVNDLFPEDVAHLLNRMDYEDAQYLFLRLPTEVGSQVLPELNDELRERFLDWLSQEQITELVEEMPSDDATDIVSELPKDKAEEVLEELSDEDSSELAELLQYDESTAGGIMQKEVITVKKTDTVKRAIQAVRRAAREKNEQLYTIYVIDEKNLLVGSLPVADLILLPPSRRIYKVMEPDVIHVRTNVDQEEVAKIFKKYNIISLPVTDFAGHLVGRITIDDVVDVITEEASEDILRMGGVSEDEHISTTPLIALRRRLPWLYINLATAFLASSVVAMFAGTIEHVVILAALMPIVAGMGGNAATQTITVIVRGIALGEITDANRKRALYKELRIGLMNGVANGVLTGTVIGIFNKNAVLGLVICMAMVINMFVAGMAGTIVPLTLKWLKIDPALASAVIVTTFTDVFGFASFLGLATLLLKFLLPS
ncbi:MAG: magnesium transporter [Acidobacteriota bacterium]